MNFLEQQYLNKMRRHTGEQIIRVAPTLDGLYNFTEKLVTLDSITSTKIEVSWYPYSVKRIWIDDPFFDDKWEALSDVLLNKNPEYSEIEGKFVMRKISCKDRSYTNTFATKYKMLHATKTHLFLEQMASTGKTNQLIIHKDRGVYEGWVVDPKYN